MEASRAVLDAARRRRRLTTTAVVIVALVAIGYLAITGLAGSSVYYVTIPELRAQPDRSGAVRVSGFVQPGSIQVTNDPLELRFVLEDEGGRIDVVHAGIRPDMLRDEANAVVEGKLNDQGVLVADEIMLKCPSKYEAAATATASP